jgi:predicted dehydrogenase
MFEKKRNQEEEKMINGERIIERPIRWAMVGGGQGSFFGYMHRSGALRDRSFDLLAGAFSTEHGRCKKFGESIGVVEERCYPDYKTMFAIEASRRDGIEAVTIATPNKTHYEIAKAALEAGLHVICEKPLCFKNEEAEELVRLSSEKKLIFGVTFGFSGYQMIHQAREMVIRGDLGKIRLVNMQFSHGSFNLPVENNIPAFRWRVDPEIAGPSFVLADIGIHTLFLAETIVPGLTIERLLCTRQTFVEGRQLEDNAYVLLQFKGGTGGMLWASAINSGSMHGQKIRVVGKKASIEWWDEHPNQLKYEIEGESAMLMDRATGYLYQEALEYDRISCGHPEGLFESWANLYRRFSIAIDAAKRDDQVFLNNFWYPNVKAGARAVKFVSACIRSAESDSVWVDL